jgi:hypothetical protein
MSCGPGGSDNQACRQARFSCRACTLDRYDNDPLCNPYTRQRLVGEIDRGWFPAYAIDNAWLMTV